MLFSTGIRTHPIYGGTPQNPSPDRPASVGLVAHLTSSFFIPGGCFNTAVRSCGEASCLRACTLGVLNLSSTPIRMAVHCAAAPTMFPSLYPSQHRGYTILCTGGSKP